MKTYIKLTFTILSFTLLLLSCKKDKQEDTEVSVKNTNWLATITITGNTTTQNIFEFGGNESVFAWHPVAIISYNGSWTQDRKIVNFTFKEFTANGDYFWDNTGTLSSDGMTYTGTMKRRGVEGSGTFIAKKM